MRRAGAEPLAIHLAAPFWNAQKTQTMFSRRHVAAVADVADALSS
jgi:hypothetical protein